MATKIELSGLTLGKKLTRRLKGQMRSLQPKGNIDMVKASLAAVSSLHMTKAIAEALSTGQPIEASMLGGLESSTRSKFFGGGSAFGFFVEDITGGVPDTRNLPTADISFDNASQKLAEAVSKANDKTWAEVTKESGELIKTFSYSAIGEWLNGLSGGVEMKAYQENKPFSIHIGGSDKQTARSKQQIFEIALKKLYEKMNTLYVMSTDPSYDAGGKKVKIVAADLFHELIFDEAVRALSEELITVKISSEAKASTVNQTPNGQSFNIGEVAYSLAFDYSKIDAVFAKIGEDIKKSVLSDTSGGFHGEHILKARMYREHRNLYPGNDNRNFFNDVLDYMYVNGVYGITQK